MNPNRIRTSAIAAAALALLSVTSCSGGNDSPNDSTDDSPDAAAEEVVLLAYDAFTPEEGIFDEFTAATGTKVKVVTAGDSGTVVSKAVLAAGNPEGDVLWGIDSTTLSRAQRAGVLESYEPVDHGDVCVNYDKEWYSRTALEPPGSLDDLVKPQYKGHLVVEDPAKSSPGLAFLMASVARYGDGWDEWWEKLVANDVTVAADWTTAYTLEFSGGSGRGTHPLVVSYSSSPPAEVLYSEIPLDSAPTGVVTPTCFRQTEYVGVLRGTPRAASAGALVEYLLGRRFQESMPLSLFVYPVHPQAVLPEVFVRHAVRVTDPLELPAAEIDAHREEWIERWRDIAL